MSVEFDRFPGKFDSRVLERETVDRWIGRSLEQFAPLTHARLHKNLGHIV